MFNFLDYSSLQFIIDITAWKMIMASIKIGILVPRKKNKQKIQPIYFQNRFGVNFFAVDKAKRVRFELLFYRTSLNGREHHCISILFIQKFTVFSMLGIIWRKKASMYSRISNLKVYAFFFSNVSVSSHSSKWKTLNFERTPAAKLFGEMCSYL